MLNAADPIVAEMADACPGTVTFFASDRHHPAMATHRAQGKRCVLHRRRRAGRGEGAWGRSAHAAGATSRSRATARSGSRSRTRWSSVAAAWALGLDWDTIRRGLATFVNDAATAPGRFNVFDYRGATVIADYGHNRDAMRGAGARGGSRWPTRRSVVISGAGDRRDEDIRRQTADPGRGV